MPASSQALSGLILVNLPKARCRRGGGQEEFGEVPAAGWRSTWFTFYSIQTCFLLICFPFRFLPFTPRFWSQRRDPLTTRGESLTWKLPARKVCLGEREREGEGETIDLCFLSHKVGNRLCWGKREQIKALFPAGTAHQNLFRVKSSGRSCSDSFLLYQVCVCALEVGGTWKRVFFFFFFKLPFP